MQSSDELNLCTNTAPIMSHATMPQTTSLQRRRFLRVGILLGLCALMLTAAPRLRAAEKQSPVREVEGRVLNNNDEPLTNAIVHIRDMNNMKELTVFVDENGYFRYDELVRTVDYRVWAECNGKKSPEKLLSSFELRDLFQLRLRIDIPVTK